MSAGPIDMSYISLPGFFSLKIEMSDENMKKMRPVKKYVLVAWSAGDELRGTKCTRPMKENARIPSEGYI